MPRTDWTSTTPADAEHHERAHTEPDDDPPDLDGDWTPADLERHRKRARRLEMAQREAGVE